MGRTCNALRKPNEGPLSRFFASNNLGVWGKAMAYFVGSAGERYVCLFFSRKSVNECSGVLLPVSNAGVRISSLLPVLAALIVAATVAEIFTWIAYLFSPPQQTGSLLTSINWIVAGVCVFCAIAGATIIAFSQLYAMKHKSFCHGVAGGTLSIDWHRSISAFLINVLFVVNGVLFSLWAEFAASEIDAGESEDSLTLTLLGFCALALPGTLRLVWLFRARVFSDIRWGDSCTSRKSADCRRTTAEGERGRGLTAAGDSPKQKSSYDFS